MAQAGSLGGSLTPLSHGPCGAAADSVVSAFKLYPGPGYFVTLRLPPPCPDPPSSPPEPGQGPCPGSAGSHLYHPFPQPFPAQQPKCLEPLLCPTLRLASPPSALSSVPVTEGLLGTCPPHGRWHALQPTCCPATSVLLPQPCWVFAQVSLSRTSLTWPPSVILRPTPSLAPPLFLHSSHPPSVHSICVCLHPLPRMLLEDRGFAYFVLCFLSFSLSLCCSTGVS